MCEFAWEFNWNPNTRRYRAELSDVETGTLLYLGPWRKRQALAMLDARVLLARKLIEAGFEVLER